MCWSHLKVLEAQPFGAKSREWHIGVERFWCSVAMASADECAPVGLFDEAMSKFGGKEWRYELLSVARSKRVDNDPPQTVTLLQFTRDALRPMTNVRTAWTIIDIVENVDMAGVWAASQLAERLSSGAEDVALPQKVLVKKQLV